MEALNVATAQEIRRSGNWLVPTLQGETRLQKPPLTAWLTSAVIGDDLMQALSSPRFAQRNSAFIRLALLVRAEALVLACATLIVVFYTGRLLFNADVGLISVIVMGTSLLFLRFSRYSMTDIPLMLFVSATNLLMLTALFNGRLWLGCVGGGVALALAILSKGPVALLQTVVPIVAFLMLMRGRNLVTTQRAKSFAPIVVGLLVFILLGLAWYFIVFLREPNAFQIWKAELARAKDPESHRNPWYRYLLLIPYLAPWSVFFVVGINASFRRRDARDVLLLLLLLLPLGVMCRFPDRHERYMLPLLPAAAVLTARAVIDFFRSGRDDRTARWIGALHWLVVASIGIGFPIVAHLALK
jgi:4-amino-4-deoxy-L-arabinose transferase-like glycosyltransferase